MQEVAEDFTLNTFVWLDVVALPQIPLAACGKKDLVRLRANLTSCGITLLVLDEEKRAFKRCVGSSRQPGLWQ